MCGTDFISDLKQSAVGDPPPNKCKKINAYTINKRTYLFNHLTLQYTGVNRS